MFVGPNAVPGARADSPSGAGAMGFDCVLSMRKDSNRASIELVVDIVIMMESFVVSNGRYSSKATTHQDMLIVPDPLT